MNDLETMVFLGCVAVVTFIAAFVHERRMDVLHGRYVEGRSEQSAGWQGALSSARADRFRWKARNMMYLTSIVGC